MLLGMPEPALFYTKDKKLNQYLAMRTKLVLITIA